MLKLFVSLIALSGVISSHALATGFNFSADTCAAEVCDDNGVCTTVSQCLYVDSKASHCQVMNNNEPLSCNDIQSRTQLTSAGQCQSLGNGTKESPWCSVAQAASGAPAGSLVLMAPGRYLTPGGTHGLNDFNNDGSLNAPIVFRNATFNPDQPSIPAEEVVITPYTNVSNWHQLESSDDYLICGHEGTLGDSSTFNGITTNIKPLNDDKPFMRLFSEACGTSTELQAKNYLQDLSWLPSYRSNDQGYFVQVWTEGLVKGGATCPTLTSGQGGKTVVRVSKTESIQECGDLSLQVTGVGHTIHLKSTGDVCGDIEEVITRQGLDPLLLNFKDKEADYVRFEGLTIDAAKYGITIETDHIQLSYSKIQGSYKDAVKAIGNEAWDHRAPNSCPRLEIAPIAGEPANELKDLINYCQGNTNDTLLSGEYISPPSCTGTTLNVSDLNSQYFYWDLPFEQAQSEMLAARDSSLDEHCVGSECIAQTKGTFKKYCSEVVPTFNLTEDGSSLTIPNNCNDFYYFNAESVVLNNNELRYFGEDAIDITGGDHWRVYGNTIHDSIITHGASQMPSGILTKNASVDNRIEENLLYNIHHSVTGIISLGGDPAEKGSAKDISAINNVMLSVSGKNIIHVPSCEGCLVAHNLLMDVTLGEEGSRSRAFAHVGGNRKNCVSSSGAPIDCSTEKRGAAYEGKDNSIVNNVIELMKWRDTDSYRLISFGGVKSDEQYNYNGDKGLCVAANNINAGNGITSVTTHVSESEVSGLSCKLDSSHQTEKLTYNNERVNQCVIEQQQNQTGIDDKSLYKCLESTSENMTGEPVSLKASSIFSDIGFSYENANIKLIGQCPLTGTSCTEDSQCTTGVCVVDESYIDECKLGPLNSSTSVDSNCKVLLEAPMGPNKQIVNAYPEFNWRNVEGDLEYQFLLYRFHSDGGANNAAWSELLSYDNVSMSECNGYEICSHRAKHLLTDGVYTWKLKRKSEDGWGSWSTTQVFTVTEPTRQGHIAEQPTGLISPQVGEHVINNPELVWQYDPYASDYSILFYRYNGSYELLANLKLNSEEVACEYESGCKISVSKLLGLMNSIETELTPGTYTWKTKKWTNGIASSWNSPTSVFYVD